MCHWDGMVLTLVFMDASFWKGLLCNLSHMISLCRPWNNGAADKDMHLNQLQPMDFC